MARYLGKCFGWVFIMATIIIITFLWALPKTENKGSNRLKRQAGVFQNIFGAFQNVHECCVVPPVIADNVLRKCGGSPQTYSYAGQQVQAAPRKAVIPINRVGNSIQRVVSNIGTGLFGAFRQFMNFGRGKRQVEGSETPVDPGVTVPVETASVDPTTAAATDTQPSVETFSPVESSPSTETPSNTPISPGTGGSTASPGLQKFGIQSVMTTNNTIRQAETITSLHTTLQSVVKNTTQVEKWNAIISSAAEQCAGPTSRFGYETSESRAAINSTFTATCNYTDRINIPERYQMFTIKFFNVTVDGKAEAYDGVFTGRFSNVGGIVYTLVINQLGTAKVISFIEASDGLKMEANVSTSAKDIHMKIVFSLEFPENFTEEIIGETDIIDTSNNSIARGTIEYDVKKKIPIGGTAVIKGDELCVNGTSETKNGTRFTYEGCIKLIKDPVSASGSVNTSEGHLINLSLQPKSGTVEEGIQFEGKGISVTLKNETARAESDITEIMIITGKVEPVDPVTLAYTGSVTMKEVKSVASNLPVQMSGIGNFAILGDGFTVIATGSMTAPDGTPFTYTSNAIFNLPEIFVSYEDSKGHTFRSSITTSASISVVSVRGTGQFERQPFSIHGDLGVSTEGGTYVGIFNSMMFGKVNVNGTFTYSPEGEHVLSAQAISTRDGLPLVETTLVLLLGEASINNGFQVTTLLSNKIGSILFNFPSKRCAFV